MTETAQIQQEASSTVLGRRNDAAETRVEQRVTSDPALRALHEGTLDSPHVSPERTSHSVPDDVHHAVSSAGSRLRPDTQRSMESAFGESFDDVRIHTNADADRGARAIDSAAFATGQDIAFASGAYQPDTALGRGVIAHELAHVSDMRSGRDTPGAVRGFEWLARLFGGGTFSDAELLRFIRSMVNSGDSQDFTMVSDNMARELVLERGLHNAKNLSEEQRGTEWEKVSDLKIRFRLIQHLLDGVSTNDDQEAVLKILRDAEQWEREQLIRAFGEEALYDRFDGAQLDQLTMIVTTGFKRNKKKVPGTAQSERGNTPIRWELDYTIRNAPGLSSMIKGLNIEDFKVKPNSSDGFQTVAQNAMFEGDNERGKLISDKFSHPKQQSGVGAMTYWIVPKDPKNRAAYALSTRTPLPDKGYDPVLAAPNQTVRANLDIEMGAATIGEVVKGTSGTTGTTTKKIDSTRTDHSEAHTDSTSKSDETHSQNTERESDAVQRSLANTKKQVVGVQIEENWQKSISTTKEQLREMERSWTSQTSSSKTTNVNVSAGMTGEAAASLREKLNIGAEGEAKLSEIGTGMLGTVLQKLPIPQGKTLGAILSMIGSASAGLKLILSGEAEAKQELRITGTLSGTAGRMWSEAKSNGFNLTKSNSSKKSDTENSSQGGGRTDSASSSSGQSASVSATKEKSKEKTSGSRHRTGSGSSDTTTDGTSVLDSQQTDTLDHTTTTEQTRRDLLVPVVKDQSLTFHIERNEWGQQNPRSVSGETKEGSAKEDQN